MKQLFTFNLLVLFSIALQAQMTIAEARLQPVGTVVTVKGIVTNGQELGSIRYLQDGTAGIAAYSSTLSSVLRGDSITVTGTLKSYNNLLEIDPIANFTVLSTNNPVPQPHLITPSQVGESLEAQLITIENATIMGASGNFTGNTNYTISSGGQNTVIRVGNGNPLVGTLIPSNPFTLVAIVSQFSSTNPTTGYQLLPRDTNDIIPDEGIAITIPLNANVIETNSLQLSWQTDSIGSTEYFYGLTPALELGHVNVGFSGTVHQISISCQPGTLVYINAFSVNGSDSAFTGTKVFVSKSLSSGEIIVYFNQPVDTMVSGGINAISLINQFADTIVAYINRAQETIDMMMYDNDCRAIIDALNAAHDRGVQIRFISDIPGPTEPEDTVLVHLNPGIAFLAGNEESIMHNKIMIFDRENVNLCQVMVGSTNHTMANLNKDYNNMVIIQDQSLAKAYMLEFYEMWGSTTMTPNPALAKFGSQKSDNTPHQLNIGGKRVELFFSPSDQTTSKINNAILTANHNLDFGVMAFTEDVLGNAVKAVHTSGALVRGIIDYVEFTGSEFQMLLNNNISVLDYQNTDGSQWPEGATFHSKYAIIDHGFPDSDPLVVNGSHNWTATADSRNDENTLIIHDATIANLFHQEFTKSYHNLLTPVPMDDSVTTPINTMVPINCFVNDWVHYQVPTTTASIFRHPQHGSAMVAGEIIIYTPTTNYTGIDSIGYRVCNATIAGLCGEAWIRIGVLPHVGLNDNQKTSGIEIFPNPANQSVVLKSPFDGKVSVVVSNVAGQVYAKKEVEFNVGQAYLELGDIPAGVYFLQITTCEGQSFGKFIKE